MSYFKEREKQRAQRQLAEQLHWTRNLPPNVSLNLSGTWELEASELATDDDTGELGDAEGDEEEAEEFQAPMRRRRRQGDDRRRRAGSLERNEA